MNEWKREKSYCVMIFVEPKETNNSLTSGCGKAEVKLNLISWMILKYSEIILPMITFILWSSAFVCFNTFHAMWLFDKQWTTEWSSHLTWSYHFLLFWSHDNVYSGELFFPFSFNFISLILNYNKKIFQFRLNFFSHFIIKYLQAKIFLLVELFSRLNDRKSDSV